jgi:hypothetical protein
MTADRETIIKIFKGLISPNRDYQIFSMQKNKLLSLLDMKEILNPSVTSITKVFGPDTINMVTMVNMVTDEEKLNIVMFICVWQPTMLGREWINCFLKCGVSLDHKDINGMSTQDYLEKYHYV